MKSGLLLLAVAVALVVRLLPAASLSFGTDDGIQWYVAQVPWSDIVARIRDIGEVHPPLSFYWVHLWMALGAQSELGLRLSMIVLGVLTVAVVWKLAFDMWGRSAAASAALVLAMSSYHVSCCEEIRMYAMAALWLAIAAWGLWHLKARAGLVAYVLAATAALYTQYLTGFVLLMLTPLCLGRQYPWKRWGVANLAVAVLFAPWVPELLAQAHAQPLGLRAPPPLAWFPELMFQMALGPTLPLPLAGWEGVVEPLKWSGLLLPGLLLWLLRGRDTSPARWLAVALMGPMILLAALSSFTPLRVFEYRYFAMVVPFFALLAGWGAERIPRPLQRGLALWLLGFNLCSIGLLWQDPSLGNADWRGAADYLAPRLATQDTVWVQPGMFAAVLSYYRAFPQGIQLMPLNSLPDTVAAPNGRLWLIDTPAHPLVRQLHPEAWLDAHSLHADPDYTWSNRNFFPANVIHIQLYAK